MCAMEEFENLIGYIGYLPLIVKSKVTTPHHGSGKKPPSPLAEACSPHSGALTYGNLSTSMSEISETMNRIIREQTKSMRSSKNKCY